MDKYRVFLGYRGETSGNTEGLNFMKALNAFLKKDDFYEQQYGNIYFSPDTDTFGNFINDIPEIMSSVEYFILPLTKGFFDDFWDNGRECINESSVTYKEIIGAISSNMSTRFICIEFEGFRMADNIELIKKIFGDRHEMITAAKTVTYSDEKKNEILQMISEELVRSEYRSEGAATLLASLVPNVALGFKTDTERSERFPFYKRLNGAKRITLLNFAGSSFISNVKISKVYEECNYLSRWFKLNLLGGNIEATLIFTDPYCPAAVDAAAYKMYPKGSVDIDKNLIIAENIRDIIHFIRSRESEKAKISVYLTRIALPYGIFVSEHSNKSDNNMKIDMYSAVTGDDQQRPSFYLSEENESTRPLYSFFCNNLIAIRDNYSYRYDGRNSIEWLLDSQRHIIHKGRITADTRPHTKAAFEACIEKGCPIEIDLLRLKDGTIIAGRSEEMTEGFGEEEKHLGEMNKSDITKYRRRLACTHSEGNSILTFEGLLELVGGRVPLLIELKKDYSLDAETLREFCDEVLETLRNYFRKYSSIFVERYGTGSKTFSGYGVALHSAHPDMLGYIRSRECIVPCGIISTDFSGVESLPEEIVMLLTPGGFRMNTGAEDSKQNHEMITRAQFAEMHASMNFEYMPYPDFLSYDIRQLEKNMELIRNYKKTKKINIPLLAWTITNEDDEMTASDLCDNMVTEGKERFS